MLAAAKPMGPAEAEGWGTGDGLAIHPARDVGRAAGVGWNGYKHIEESQIYSNSNFKTAQLPKNKK